MRACGVLMPVASLPSAYGIGAFSKQAYEFIDLLKRAGQKYWQILPIGPTGYGDSPYQTFSAFAGNPYFIDLNDWIERGLLTKAECDACQFDSQDSSVDYEQLYQNRYRLWKLAYQRSGAENQPEFQDFCRENQWWLDNYSLYTAVKKYFKDVSWTEWEEDIRYRRPEAVAYYEEKLKPEIGIWKFLQYEFRVQWDRLKGYANQQGIRMIGDIPIYVAFDSADCWSQPELFQLDQERMPIAVAGCPPDGFSDDGQLWGNPLYDWDYHKGQSYSWWIQRISYCFKLYDTLRVDHFRGFDEYYSIPAGQETARGGWWKPGPGYDIFDQLEQKLGKLDIIAEDLGFLTPTVLELVAKTGYPGMKVLQFAFDSREASDYLPHNYGKNCVVYTGTHDNQTTKGWYQTLEGGDKKLAMDYVNLYGREDDEILWEFIRLALMSVADLAVIPMQDYLGLDDQARINTPSTLGGNWTWRMKEGEFTPDLADKMRNMAVLYGRY